MWDFNKIKYKVDRPERQSKIGIILLPGVSGGCLSDKKYEALARNLVKEGFQVLRADLWDSAEELGKESLSRLAKFIEDAIEKLKNQGCSNIALIGKSFGGAIMLMHAIKYNNPSVRAIVLWAPAIQFNDSSNLYFFYNRKISEFKEGMQVCINKKDLEKIQIPVLILHGEKDAVIPYENSKMMAKNTKSGSFAMIQEADHSYTNEEHFSSVLKKTVDFISQNAR